MNPKDKGGGPDLKVLAVIILGFVFFGYFFSAMRQHGGVDFSDLKHIAESRKIERAVFSGPTVTLYILKPSEEGHLTSSVSVQATVDDNSRRTQLMDLFDKRGIKYSFVQEKNWTETIAYWVTFILIGYVSLMFLKHMGATNARLSNLTKAGTLSPAKENKKTLFKDVAGIDEAKEELEEVIDFLKDPSKYTKLGCKMPKGILLVGPPGCGKTLLARAVAGEAGAAFLSISGSEFVETFVGVGAARVRDLFRQAREKAPCIVFIDEIDAVGRRRNASGLSGGHDEREQTLNQTLVEMDGFAQNTGVIIMAATNRKDILDPALTRPGRFDREVFVPLPDLKGRLEILQVHSADVELEENLDLETIARGTPMFSGADLANLVNEAALRAGKKNKNRVGLEDFEYAKDKVIAGKERGAIPDEETRRQVAYHEAGHALVALNLPKADPVHKITIIRRGESLGHVQQLPEKDRYLYDKEKILTEIACLLGGRAAEKSALNTETTGAKNDIERATRFAREMIYSWGMSEEVGLVSLDFSGEGFSAGKSFFQSKNISEATLAMADQAVRRITDECFATASKIIEEKRGDLEKLAKALLEKETLDRREIDAILAN